MRHVLNIHAPFRSPDETRKELEASAKTAEEKAAVLALTADQINALSSAGAYSFESAKRPEKKHYSRETSALLTGTGWTAGTVGLGVLVGAGAVSSSVVGGMVAGSLASLYGLGRLEEKIWKEKPAGFWRTVGRGVTSPFWIPAGLLKYGWKSTKQAGKKNYNAAKSIATGKNTVGHLTDPVRWGWHVFSGTVKGFQPSKWKELKDVEKVTALPGQAITKTLKFIFDSGVSSSNKHEH